MHRSKGSDRNVGSIKWEMIKNHPTDRITNQPTDKLTDTHSHREVSLTGSVQQKCSEIFQAIDGGD